MMMVAVVACSGYSGGDGYSHSDSGYSMDASHSYGGVYGGDSGNEYSTLYDSGYSGGYSGGYDGGYSSVY